MFHTSIRLGEHCFVRNSLISTLWGKEERDGIFEINSSQPFEICFTAEFDRYIISVNDKQIGNFYHRIPLHRVNYILVKGDIKIEHIEHVKKSNTDPMAYYAL